MALLQLFADSEAGLLTTHSRYLLYAFRSKALLQAGRKELALKVSQCVAALLLLQRLTHPLQDALAACAFMPANGSTLALHAHAAALRAAHAEVRRAGGFNPGRAGI